VQSVCCSAEKQLSEVHYVVTTVKHSTGRDKNTAAAAARCVYKHSTALLLLLLLLLSLDLCCVRVRSQLLAAYACHNVHKSPVVLHALLSAAAGVLLLLLLVHLLIT
jgi:hypothetical protein